LLEKNADIFRFFQHMVAFRKAHPSLCRSRFWREDVSWYGTGPQVDQSPQSHAVAFHLRGSSQNDTDLYVMVNAAANDALFRIQQAGIWKRVVDTSLASPDDIAEPGAENPIDGSEYLLKARSVVVLMR
jgi:glycogen operon protein